MGLSRDCQQLGTLPTTAFSLRNLQSKSRWQKYYEVLDGWQGHNATILAKLRPGKDDTFAPTQSELDDSKHFCTQPMTMAQLLRVTKGQPYRLIPRHGITQSSGKQRVIDDAARGGQSERSQDANKLVLCTPFRPAQHVALVAHFTTEAEWTAQANDDPWQGAGEDWPDAYRQSPISPEEVLGCVVCFWHHQWNTPAFQIYSSLLFGLPLAVTSFIPSWWKQWADDSFEYSSACTLTTLTSRTNSPVEHLPNGPLPR